MKQLLAVIVLSVLFGGTIIDEDEMDIEYAEEKQEAKALLEMVPAPWTEERIKEEITTQAQHYGVSADTINAVVKCESGYNIKARGDGGKSRGLVQIHSTYHPEVTDDMADSPSFAIEFLAKALSEGNGKLWTCYRNIHSTPSTI